MAMYFGSGSGRCPSMTTTVTKTFTRTELNELRSTYSKQETFNSVVLGLLIGQTVAPISAALKATDYFVNVALTTLTTCTESFIKTNAEKINDLLCESSASSMTLNVKVKCVNKGQNGHYWVIDSFTVA